MRGYYFCLPAKQKVFVSSKAYFLKKEFLSKRISAFKVELDEIQWVEEPTPVTESEPNLIRSNLEPNIQIFLR